MKDIFAAVETYLKRRRIPEITEGVVVSAQNGSADILVGGAQGTLRAHYASNVQLLPGMRCLLVRLETMPGWVVVAHFGDSRVGTQQATSEEIHPPTNLRALWSGGTLVASWNAQPDTLYEIQSSDGSGMKTMGITSGGAYAFPAPQESTSALVRLRAMDRRGRVSSWSQPVSVTRPAEQSFTLFSQKGDLLTYTTGPFVLRVGNDGEVLTADSSSPAGVKWAPAGIGGLVDKGDLLSHNGLAVTRLPVGANNRVLAADDTAPTGLRWRVVGELLPASSKGQLLVHNGTTLVALSPGSDNRYLCSDITAPTGLKWASPPVTDPSSILTQVGDILVRGTSGVAALSVSADQRILMTEYGTPGKLWWHTRKHAVGFESATTGVLLTLDTSDNLTTLSRGNANTVLTVDMTSSTHLAWRSVFSLLPSNTKGDLLVHNGTTVVRLPVGTNGHVLTADSAETTGLKWSPVSSGSGILSNKGDLLSHNGTNEVRLPVGSNGQVLTADSTAPTGLKWETPASADLLLSAKGQLLTRTNSALAALNPGSDGHVLTADNADATGLRWRNALQLLPAHAKGDLLVHNGTTVVRLPVGSNGQVLTADNSEATGLKWASSSGGGGGTPLTTKGDLLTHDGTTTVRLAVGPDDYMLVADSDAEGGLAWRYNYLDALNNPGDLLTRSTTGYHILSAGSDGQVLTVNTNAPHRLVWQDARYYAYDLVTTITINSATSDDFLFIDLTDGVYNNYRDLLIEIEGSLDPSSAGPHSTAYVRFNDDTNGYNYRWSVLVGGTIPAAITDFGFPYGWRGGLAGNGGFGRFVFQFYNFHSTNGRHTYRIDSYYVIIADPNAPTIEAYTLQGWGIWLSSSRLNDLTFNIAPWDFVAPGFTARVFGIRTRVL
jgi:hypothetical protein